jgi:flagellar basal body-associated protein FliL
MQEEEIQNEAKKNSKKEIWLFLIFIDIIALCVLGFFIYNSFFDGLEISVADGLRGDIFLEEVLVEDIKTEPSAPKKDEPKKTEAKKPESAAEVKKEEKLAAKAETDGTAKPKEEPVKPEVKKEAPKRQSIFVSGTGKTRKVTFKYYGDAKKVAVIAGFTMRKPVAMKKSGSEWSTTIIIYPGEYRYKYIVDGKEIPDPNAEEDSGRSILIVK